MNKRIKKILITVLAFFTGCGPNLSPRTENFYRVSSLIESELNQDLSLVPTGLGMGMPNGKITKYKIFLNHPTVMTIEQGRNLLIESARIALEKFNSDLKIQEYLDSHPFDIQNLSISIYSRSYMQNPAPEGYVHFALLINSELYYGVYNAQIDRLVDTYTETYEEALQKECRVE
jgi:hypothetical protein